MLVSAFVGSAGVVVGSAVAFFSFPAKFQFGSGDKLRSWAGPFSMPVMSSLGDLADVMGDIEDVVGSVGNMMGNVGDMGNVEDVVENVRDMMGNLGDMMGNVGYMREIVVRNVG